jgi:hypothetical protein
MGSTGVPWQAHGKRLICRLVAVLSLALCGCTPPVSHLTEAQAAAVAVATPDQATYLLGPEDTLKFPSGKNRPDQATGRAAGR